MATINILSWAVLSLCAINCCAERTTSVVNAAVSGSPTATTTAPVGGAEAVADDSVNASTVGTTREPLGPLTAAAYAECENTIVSFVEEKELCIRPGDGSSRHAEYTCSNRCGIRKELGNSDDCACDVTCVAYKDCCHDMRSVCPDVYKRGRDTFGHLDKVDPNCPGLALVLTDVPLTSATEETLTTQELSTNIGFHDYPHTQDLSLEALFDTFDTMLVAETKLGLIFDSYKSPSLYGVAKQQLAFVPRELTFACMTLNLYIQSFRNSLRVLPYCVPTAIQDVWTVLHRPCPTHTLVSCKCKKGHTMDKYLSDLCQGQNGTVSITERHGSIKFNVGSHFESPRTNQERCGQQTEDDHSDTGVVEVDSATVFIPMTGTIGRDQTAVSITLTPSFVPPANISKPRVSGGGVNAGGLGHENNNDTIIGGRYNELIPAQEFEFIAEFDGLLEKKIRCTSFSGRLSQCRLEECTQGALLLDVRDFEWAYSGRACVLPVLATAQNSESYSNMSLCNCLRVAGAMTSLQVWSVKVRDADHSQCALLLETRLQGEPTHLEPYDFSEPSRIMPREALSPLLVQARLQEKLEIPENACPGETVDDLKICFYAPNLYWPGMHKLAACVEISQRTLEPGMTSRDGGRPGSLYVLVALSALVLLNLRKGL